MALVPPPLLKRKQKDGSEPHFPLSRPDEAAACRCTPSCGTRAEGAKSPRRHSSPTPPTRRGDTKGVPKTNGDEHPVTAQTCTVTATRAGGGGKGIGYERGGIRKEREIAGSRPLATPSPRQRLGRRGRGGRGRGETRRRTETKNTGREAETEQALTEGAAETARPLGYFFGERRAEKD